MFKLHPYLYKIFLKIFIYFAFISASYAEELYYPFDPVRPLGMGGASVAMSNDHNSIWTNPSGIARIRKARSRHTVHFWTFPAIVAGANEEGQSFFNKLQSSAGSGTMAQNINEAVKNSSNKSKFKPLWARLSANPLIYLEAAPNTPIAISAFAASTVKLVFITDDGSESAQVQALTDIGSTLTMAWTNRTNRINFGIQIRPTARYAFDDKINTQILTDKKTMEKRIKSDSNSAVAVGIDTGFMWTFADFWFPTLGVAVYNIPTSCQDQYLNPFTETRQKICGTKYGGTINNPESLFLVDPTDIRAGISITPRLSRKIALRFAIDMHHLYLTDGNRYIGLPGIEPIKQTHAGVELFFGNPLELNPLSLRAGINQGFVTTGATLRISFLTLEAALYGKDISSEPSQAKDQRFLLSFSGDF